MRESPTLEILREYKMGEETPARTRVLLLRWGWNEDGAKALMEMVDAGEMLADIPGPEKADDPPTSQEDKP